MLRSLLSPLLVRSLIGISFLLPLLQACQDNPSAGATRNEPNVETLAVASVTAGARDQAQTDSAPLKSFTATPALSPQPAASTLMPQPLQNGASISSTQAAATTSQLRLVYLQNQDIYLRLGTGSSRQLTHGEQVHQLRISPDGQLVAFTRSVDEYHEELWAIGTDGNGERKLVGVDELSAIDPRALAVVPDMLAWIPGTHLVAFNTRQIIEGPGSAMYNDLHLVNADSRQIQTLLPPSQGGQFFPSPDGTQFAVTSPTSISLIDVNGSNLRRDVLVYEPVTTYSEYQYAAQPVWEANSTGLLAAIPPPDPLAVPLQSTTLWQVPIDGSKARQLGSIATGSFFGMDVYYSPDRSHILYLNSSGNPDQNLRALHIARPDGSQDSIYVTAKDLTISSWVPDSLHFAFSLGNPAVLQLARIGGQFQPVADVSASPLDLRWIDDEQFIYVISGSNGYEIRLHSLQGEDVLLGTAAASQSIYDFAWQPPSS
jgi:dipeptidyl aminopeptidase/acylaminoacyl peptidase